MQQKIKRELEEDWAKAKNFIPKLNEVIIYDCKDGIKFKIGNGTTHVNDLPFTDESLCFMTADGAFKLKEE